MPNAFDQSEYPTTEPATLAVGDRWTWRKALTDYPAASYTLTYAARQHAETPNTIAITATDDGTDHIVEVSRATTAKYEPGTYEWVAYITRDSDSERIGVARGTWTVEPNAAADGADPRSHAKIMLDKLEDVIQGRADRQILSGYSLGDRSLQYASLAELRDARDAYRAEYLREVRQERIARGLNPGTSVGVRF